MVKMEAIVSSEFPALPQGSFLRIITYCLHIADRKRDKFVKELQGIDKWSSRMDWSSMGMLITDL